MTSPLPSRGEIWEVNLDPTRGHEQAGVRPALVVSVDAFNRGPAGLVVVLPITTIAKGIPFHIAVSPPEGRVKRPSFIKCEGCPVRIKRATHRPMGIGFRAHYERRRRPVADSA